MPHQPKRGDVLIAWTNGARGDGRRVINLRIEDEVTGNFIIDVDMTGELFASILGNAVTRVSGARLRPEAAPAGPWEPAEQPDPAHETLTVHLDNRTAAFVPDEPRKPLFEGAEALPPEPGTCPFCGSSAPHGPHEAAEQPEPAHDPAPSGYNAACCDPGPYCDDLPGCVLNRLASDRAAEQPEGGDRD